MEKVVYLDADTLVLKDVAVLFDTSLTSATPATYAVAAVSRRYKPMCGSYINCRSVEVKSLLAAENITEPDKLLDAFNAGVMVIHLGRWKALGLTRQVEFWINWNNDLPLYKLGSNPPLVLSVRDQFQHLDNRWNCQRGHTCWDRGDAGVVHWSGANKPWVLEFERDRIEWLPSLWRAHNGSQLPKKCFAGLPEPGAEAGSLLPQNKAARKPRGGRFQDQRVAENDAKESAQRLKDRAEEQLRPTLELLQRLEQGFVVSLRRHKTDLETSRLGLRAQTRDPHSCLERLLFRAQSKSDVPETRYTVVARVERTKCKRVANLVCGRRFRPRRTRRVGCGARRPWPHL